MNTKGEKRLGVAAVNYACPICGKINPEAGGVVMGTLETIKGAEQIESLHNKIIGYSDEPCPTCKDYIKQGAFFVIGVDADKMKDVNQPYRTGHLVGIKRDSDFVRSLPDDCKKWHAVMMDYREMMQIGLIKKIKKIG